MGDGKLVIDTDLDNSGIKQGLKETEQSLKSQAAKLASEYKKQGMSASDAFKKAWSEIDRSAANSSNSTSKHWANSVMSINEKVSKMGSLAVKGAKVAAAAIAAIGGALSLAGGAVIKVGMDFEAGMSEVASISGATGSDLEALTEKAKEMGAKTKFSATQSAEAFKYMAMAGWDTKAMLGGIEGVMNLAAASGENLGTVSDIVTDALTAFGLQASDSAHFADVLAMASSRSNTNVGMMGATFKYVAPLAGAMNYSIEDTAVAIGLMANAGIKGEQAGTSLRSMFTRLADPPKDAADAMDALGISITNADGSMKPLSEVMGVLREKFSGLSESQKIEMASSIAGQEAMSGLLAIVNAAPADYENLVASINDAGGAAKGMAETMNDNLQGSITLMKSALEGLGIQIYETMDADLNTAVKNGIKYVDALSKAFEKDGLGGAVKEAGTIFADLATEAARQAPKMVRSAVTFIKSFVRGIKDNKGQIKSAAIDLVKTLADALVDLLPASVKRPVKEALDAIIKLFSGGGIAKAGEPVINLFKNMGKMAVDVAAAGIKTLAGIIEAVGDNLNILIPLLSAAVGVLVTYKIATEVSKGLEAMAAASAILSAAESVEAISAAVATGALTAKSIIVAVLTGELTLAAGATALFSAAMNVLSGPIGIVIAAVGLLTACFVAYSTTNHEIQTSTEGLIQKNNELIDSIEATNQKIDDNIARRQESRTSAEAEAGGIDILTDSLFKLSDKQTKTTEEKAQMAAIVDQLNEKVPELGLAIDKETGYLSMNKDQIREVIDANKEMLQVKAATADLTRIANDQYEATRQLTQAEKEYAELNQLLIDKESEYNAVKKEMNDTMSTGGIVSQELIEKAEVLGQEVTDLTANHDELGATIKTTEEQLSGLSAEYQYAMDYIGDHSALDSAGKSFAELGGDSELAATITSGSSEEIQAAVDGIASGFKDSTTATKAELDQQVTNLEEQTALMKAALNEGMPGVSQEMVDGMSALVIAAKTELGNLPAAGTDCTNGLMTNINGQKDALIATGADAALATNTGFEGANLPGLLAGNGSLAMGGFLDAMNSRTSVAAQTGAASSRAASNGFNSTNLPGLLSQNASSAMTSYLSAVSSQQGNVTNSGQKTSRSLLNGVEALNPSATLGNKGRSYLTSFVQAISGQQGNVKNSGATTSRSVFSGVESTNPNATMQRVGTDMGTMFTSGLTSKNGSSRSAGAGVAQNARSGAAGVSAYSVGGDFASGYANGIWGGIGAAVSAAASMAAQAIAAVKSAQASASPSKKTRKLAHDFDAGYYEGIKDDIPMAEKAAGMLSEAAQDALGGKIGLDLTGVDVSAVSRQMEAAVLSKKAELSAVMTAPLIERIYQEVEAAVVEKRDSAKLLAAEIVNAFVRAGVRVECDEREFGRLVGDLI